MKLFEVSVSDVHKINVECRTAFVPKRRVSQAKPNRQNKYFHTISVIGSNHRSMNHIQSQIHNEHQFHVTINQNYETYCSW